MTEIAAAAAQSVAALATTAAVFVALWVAHKDWQRADREDRRRQETRAQLVILSYRVGTPFLAVVDNCGREPILDVELTDAGRVEREDSYRWQVREGLGAETFARFVDAGNTWQVPLDLLNSTGEKYGGTRSYTYTVTVRFTDADGVRWERTNDELPQRV